MITPAVLRKAHDVAYGLDVGVERGEKNLDQFVDAFLYCLFARVTTVGGGGHFTDTSFKTLALQQVAPDHVITKQVA